MAENLMEEDKIYNILIIASVIGIVAILTMIIAFNPDNNYTELYFETPLPDQVELNKDYSFSFSIHNLEGKEMNYAYTVYIEYYSPLNKITSIETINSNSVNLAHDEIATIPSNINIEEDFTTARIVVESNNQQIYFEVGQ